MARRQGAVPGLLRAGCPDYSGRWGVKHHAPRLAARQRGILAFMPLTVVGPGRLIVAGEAARVPPGVGSCVLPRSQVPLPVPRLQNASGRRPSYLDRDRLNITTLQVKSNNISLSEYFFMVNNHEAR